MLISVGGRSVGPFRLLISLNGYDKSQENYPSQNCPVASKRDILENIAASKQAAKPNLVGSKHWRLVSSVI